MLKTVGSGVAALDMTSTRETAPLFGAVSDAERRLLARAASAYPDLCYEGCSHARLSEISRRDGVDLATAVFYDRIRRAPRNQPLVRALESPAFDRATDFARGRLLIVPALFYRERPETGGDGAIVATVAREAGLDVELVPVGSGATAAENARLVGELLPARTVEPTVVVSLSKGAADLRLALGGMPVPRGLRAWVSVSGLLRPTPAIDRLLARWWTRLALAALLRHQRGSAGLPREFASGRGSPLEEPVTAPSGLPVINLIGSPLSHHLGTPFGRRRHRQMSRLGPNDGLTLLRDAILEPGTVYPVWGADHYFRLPAIATLLRRLVGYFCSLGFLRPAPSLMPSPSQERH
jgi:hypothetical protein